MDKQLKRGWAIFSITLGLPSFIAFGFLIAIPGIIVGHIARSKAKNLPETYGGEKLALIGLILCYLALALDVGAVIYVAINNPEAIQSIK